jgi:type VI secretion system lysozyme-like protein
MPASPLFSDGTAKEDVLYKPYTLKRLTDYDPSEQSVEQSEGSGSLITGAQLRDDVFDNIDMLFNSRSHASLSDLKGYEEVEESVLGFGISDFCGKHSSTASREAMREHITRQIRLFEPRLDPASVGVEFKDNQKSDHSSLEFRISGKIKVRGVNEEIAFISRLNLESGNAELRFDDY